MDMSNDRPYSCFRAAKVRQKIAGRCRRAKTELGTDGNPSEPVGFSETERKSFRGWLNSDRSRDPRPTAAQFTKEMARISRAMGEIGKNLDEAFNPSRYPRRSFLWWLEKGNRKTADR